MLQQLKCSPVGLHDLASRYANARRQPLPVVHVGSEHFKQVLHVSPRIIAAETVDLLNRGRLFVDEDVLRVAATSEPLTLPVRKPRKKKIFRKVRRPRQEELGHAFPGV